MVRRSCNSIMVCPDGIYSLDRLAGSLFFWNGVSSCLPPLRGCILQGIKMGDETLFWKDRWLNGRALIYLWPKEFRDNQHPNGTVWDLVFLLEKSPFSENLDTLHYRN